MRGPALLIARHGETEWNRIGRWQGATDVPLNDTGRAQARALAESLRGAGVRAVASSDLSRAAETADIVAEALGLPRIGAFAELRERGYGVFEGLTRRDCETQYAAIWSQHRPGDLIEPPGAEPVVEVVVRMQRRLAALAEAFADEGPFLVVSHGGAIRAFLASVGGDLVPPMQNGETYRVRLEAGRFASVEPLGGP
jgi:broad specificity phosphatase PhoE